MAGCRSTCFGHRQQARGGLGRLDGGVDRAAREGCDRQAGQNQPACFLFFCDFVVSPKLRTKHLYINIIHADSIQHVKLPAKLSALPRKTVGIDSGRTLGLVVPRPPDSEWPLRGASSLGLGAVRVKARSCGECWSEPYHSDVSPIHRCRVTH